jgi:hypothetical protein
MIFGGVALAMCATCGYAQSSTDNTPTRQSTPVQPATGAANKPAGQLDNSGGGLSQGMTPDEARMAFQNLDSNHDGYVSQSEFMANGDSGQRFPGCDLDHDGKLSEAEYVQCSQRPPTNGQ